MAEILYAAAGVAPIALAAWWVSRRARRRPATPPSFDEMQLAEAVVAVNPLEEYRGYET